MTFSELTFEGYAGLIRGSVAFALSTKMGDEMASDDVHEDRKDHNKKVVESATLMLVIITTIVFGCFTKLVSNCLLKDKKSDEPTVEIDDTMKSQLISDNPEENHLTPK